VDLAESNHPSISPLGRFKIKQNRSKLEFILKEISKNKKNLRKKALLEKSVYDLFCNAGITSLTAILAGEQIKKKAEKKDFFLEYQKLSEEYLSAREALVLSNIKGNAVNTNIKIWGIDRLDLIQEANLGALSSIENYDYKKSKFTTHSYFSARDRVSKASHEQARTIRLDPDASRLSAKIRDYLEKTGIKDPKIISEHLLSLGEKSATFKNISDLMPFLNKELSLDCPEESNRENPLSDLYTRIVDKTFPSPYEQVALNDSFIRLRKILPKILTKNEFEVIISCYGLRLGYKEDLTTTGKRLGISQQAAGQLYIRALKKLQKPYNKKLLA
jgi:RNA polymerase primary sigma factor